LRPSERREPANDNFCGGFSGEKVPLDPGQALGLKVRPGADH
jgi:alcohol dehydrogenase (cytochrome c)